MLPIKLFSGETDRDAVEPRPGWIRELVIEDIHGQGSPLYLISGALTHPVLHTHLLCLWQRYDALETDDDTGGAYSPLQPSLYPPSTPRLVPSRPTRPSVPAQIQGVGVPASDSQSHPPSYPPQLGRHRGVVTVQVAPGSVECRWACNLQQ